MTTPNVGLDELIANQSQPDVTVNRSFRRIDALLGKVVLAFTASLPGSPGEGDAYILTAAAAGGSQHDIAYYSGGWQFVTPRNGWLFYVIGSTSNYVFGLGSPSGWSAVSGGGGSQNIELQLACSDLTTDLTTGTSKAYVRAPRAITLSAVRASLLTASPGSPSVALVIDINRNGSTILSTKLTIDGGEKTSVTADVPYVLSGTAISDDDEITIDIDAVGAGAKGLVVTLLGAA